MTNILVTIGPASNTNKSIARFARLTKLFRLNGSHSDKTWHKETIRRIRVAVPDAFILLDVPGAKPRTTNSIPIHIKEGQSVYFGAVKETCDELVIGLSKPLPKLKSQNLKTFSVNDGQFLFDVQDTDKDYIAGKSRESFTLHSKKGVNIPQSEYDEDLQLEVFRNFIHDFKDLDVDGFGLSFIQDGSIVNKIRDLTAEKVIISKIENAKGLENVEEVIEKSDAIMIDRGDLAAEIGFSNLYNAIERISKFTKINGKPLIMATENLESMLERDTPSKSEVMSLAHSVSIGADCVMLSEETALSSNGLYIVRWLEDFLKRSKIERRIYGVRESQEKYHDIWEMLSKSKNTSVLLVSKSGHALVKFMGLSLSRDVTLVTNSEKVIQTSKLYSDKIEIINENLDANVPIEAIWQIIKKHKNLLFKNSSQIISIYVSRYVNGARANSITVFNIDDVS